MSARFFQTIMGRHFMEKTLPSMLKELKKLNINLERLNNNLDAINTVNGNIEYESNGNMNDEQNS